MPTRDFSPTLEALLEEVDETTAFAADLLRGLEVARDTLRGVHGGKVWAAQIADLLDEMLPALGDCDAYSAIKLSQGDYESVRRAVDLMSARVAAPVPLAEAAE